MPERPSIYEQEHEDFRATARAFMEKEVKPYHDQWEQDGQVDREVWRKAGEAGLLCFDVDEEYGGAGRARTSATTWCSPRRSPAPAPAASASRCTTT